MPVYQRMGVKGSGGGLPKYQREQAPYVPGSGITSRVQGAEAKILARGQESYQQAGDNLVKTVRNAGKNLIAGYEDYAKVKATELATQYKTDMNQLLRGEDGILSRVGEAAFTANQDFIEASKAKRSELLNGYDGSLVESLFNMTIDPEEAEYSLSAQNHAGAEYKTYNIRTEEAAAKMAAEQALSSSGNPEQFQRRVGESLYHLEQAFRLQGYSGEALDNKRYAAASEIFKNAVDMQLEQGNIRVAQSILDDGSKIYQQPIPHDLSHVKGVIEPGNIDIDHRKVAHLPDGSIATVKSMSISIDDQEVLIPTVIDGKIVSPEQAIAHFRQTGEHLGKFSSREAADEYAQKLHENHAVQYATGRSWMNPIDIAHARKAIKNRIEAEQKKAEAARKKRESQAAADAVDMMFAQDGADHASVLTKINQIPNKEQRELYLKAYDAYVSDEQAQLKREEEADNSRVKRLIDDQVLLSASEFSQFLEGGVFTESQKQYGLKKWQEIHGERDTVLVSDPNKLRSAWNDLQNGKSIDTIAITYGNDISHDDMQKLTIAAGKQQAARDKTIQQARINLAKQDDFFSSFVLSELKLQEGKQLSPQLQKLRSDLKYTYQQWWNSFVAEHHSAPNRAECQRFCDTLVLEVRDQWTSLSTGDQSFAEYSQQVMQQRMRRDKYQLSDKDIIAPYLAEVGLKKPISKMNAEQRARLNSFKQAYNERVTEFYNSKGRMPGDMERQEIAKYLAERTEKNWLSPDQYVFDRYVDRKYARPKNMPAGFKLRWIDSQKRWSFVNDAGQALSADEMEKLRIK